MSRKFTKKSNNLEVAKWMSVIVLIVIYIFISIFKLLAFHSLPKYNLKV